MKQCEICHKGRTFWERTPIHSYNIGMDVDFGASVMLCDNCREMFSDFEVITMLGWQT